MTSALGNENVTVIGTDPEKHQEHAWKVVRTLKGQGGGSLFVKSHPHSKQPVGRYHAESRYQDQPERCRV